MLSSLSFRYFYGPIDGTPFTLAIALPDKYGMYELSLQEEIKHSHQNGKKSIICLRIAENLTGKLSPNYFSN